MSPMLWVRLSEICRNEGFRNSCIPAFVSRMPKLTLTTDKDSGTAKWCMNEEKVFVGFVPFVSLRGHSSMAIAWCTAARTISFFVICKTRKAPSFAPGG